MGIVDAFNSVWTRAYESYGKGVPRGGEYFDKSAQFRQMQSSVAAAAPDDRWQGTASEAYAKTNKGHAEVFGKLADLDKRYGAEVDRSAATVAAGRQSLETTRSNFMAAAAGLNENKAADRAVLMRLVSGGMGEIQNTLLKTTSEQSAGAQRMNGITAEYAALGNQTFKQGGGSGDKPEDPNSKPPEPQIPEGKDPKDVKKWWDSLTEAQQRQLVHDHPDKIGNLDGIPIVGNGQPPIDVGRNAANRAVMQLDLDRVNNAARAHNVSADQVTAHPENYGLSSNDVTRYNNAVQVQKGLNDAHAKTNAPTYLQVYEPDKFDGKGRAAIAIGDPDRSANTAVVVPGTGHSVTEGWLSADDGANVFNEANKADRENHTAVVEWMGYHPPSSMTDPEVAQTNLAHQGGQLLASDVNALSATHVGNPSHVTVIGHSYGSTTVADAAAGYHMHANDVVLIGSPGTDMARSAADFQLNGGHVFVGSASTDPVTNLAGPEALGPDPAAEGYGSTRFKAEVQGFDPAFWHDHSHYYDVGSESLFSIGDIVSGHGDALEHDGMTAPHRKWPKWLPLGGLMGDPELSRPATGGHEHQ